jgi:hypothetical protein
MADTVGAGFAAGGLGGAAVGGGGAGFDDVVGFGGAVGFFATAGVGRLALVLVFFFVAICLQQTRFRAATQVFPVESP